MLRHLAKHPEEGLLAVRNSFSPTLMVQYWRSFEDLERFARNSDAPHLAAWRAFNRRIADSGDVGIWHETYRVRAQDVEAIYGNMPTSGLASVTGLVPVQRGRDSAAARIGASQHDDPALPPY